MALILAPRMMMSDEPTTLKSPLMTVPGWMVSVAPLRTWMKPEMAYAVSAYSVRLAEMSWLIVAAKVPNGSVVIEISPDGALLVPPRTVMMRYRYSVFAVSPLSVQVTVPPAAGAGTEATVANAPLAPVARSTL